MNKPNLQQVDGAGATASVSGREGEIAARQKKADETNASRTGKGTRVKVGSTRGKNPQVIDFEAFDDSKPETLPTSISEFLKIAELDAAKDEKEIVSLLIEGYNTQAYRDASDPIAEHVNSSWPEDVRKQFRLVVRNYANATGASIEDAVALIKPGIEKALSK